MTSLIRTVSQRAFEKVKTTQGCSSIFCSKLQMATYSVLSLVDRVSGGKEWGQSCSSFPALDEQPPRETLLNPFYRVLLGGCKTEAGKAAVQCFRIPFAKGLVALLRAKPLLAFVLVGPSFFGFPSLLVALANQSP